MLKFVKHHMESIAGIEIYPMISLIIFFTFFVLLSLWVVTARREYLEEQRHLPLGDNDDYNKRELL